MGVCGGRLARRAANCRLGATDGGGSGFHTQRMLIQLLLIVRTRVNRYNNHNYYKYNSQYPAEDLKYSRSRLVIMLLPIPGIAIIVRIYSLVDPIPHLLVLLAH